MSGWIFQKKEDNGTKITQNVNPVNTLKIGPGAEKWQAYWRNDYNGKWLYKDPNKENTQWEPMKTPKEKAKEKPKEKPKKTPKEKKTNQEWNAFWSVKNNKWMFQKKEDDGTKITQYENPDNTLKIGPGGEKWQAYWRNDYNGKWLYKDPNKENPQWEHFDIANTWEYNYMYNYAKVEPISSNNSLPIKNASKIKLPNIISERNVTIKDINNIIKEIKNKKIDTIVGPHEITKFKFNNRNIIFVGESHHNLPRLKDNEIYFLDLFKLELLRNNEQCYDLLVELTPKHLPIFRDTSLINFGGSYNTNNIFKTQNKNNSQSSLTDWFYDDDLIKCSSHYINPSNRNLIEYSGQCPFKNLRYHNIDLRFFSYEVKKKYEQLKNKKDYLKLIDLLVNKDGVYNVNDLIMEFNRLKIKPSDGTIEQYSNIIWNLIRKEESKIDKSLIPDLNKFKEVFLNENKELTNRHNIHKNIIGYMDYYAILRLFIKYDDNKLNRTNINSKHGNTPTKCKNINKNENIVYYCGADHIILCYKIINKYLNKQPVLMINKKNSNNKIRLTSLETYNNKIKDLFGVFEL